MRKELTNLIIVFSIIFVVIVGTGIFGFYIIDKRISELNQNLATFKKSTSENLNSLDTKIVQSEKSLSEKISNEVSTLNIDVDSLRKDTEKSTKALEDVIKEVEQQSNIELEKVKKDIKSVSVSAGDFSQIVEDVLPSVVSIITDRGMGSGVFIADNGYVVTNSHVIDSAGYVRIYTYDKKIYNAVLVGSDDSSDIAVLKINASYAPLQFDNSEEIKVGGKVIALGNPKGLDFTVTEGIVSAVNRKVGNSPIGYIQIDVPLNPGNSGGPLVNTQGKIIGINNLKLGGLESLGFAIPSNTVKDVVNKII